MFENNESKGDLHKANVMVNAAITKKHVAWTGRSSMWDIQLDGKR